MLSRQQKVVLPHLCRLIGAPSGSEPPDGDLLERFLARGDAEAFAALVRRHGPTVLGVCRRVLRHAQDAEDAFQATFLVLARKARSITRRGSLGSWLYGVAYRVALKARDDAMRRRRHERRAANRAGGQSACAGARGAVWPVLDEEVNRLPDKYRQPVVLCYFEGKTYQEAARLLGWPAGTAAARLARARALLRKRLVRRGVTLSSGALAARLAEGAGDAADAWLLAGATADAAVRWLLDPATAALSKPVIALSQGVVNAMVMERLKALVGIFVVVGLLAGGAGAFRRFGGAAPAAAAERPAEGLTAGRGPSGEEGRVAAGRPISPEEPAPSPLAPAAPSGQGEAPLGAPPRALAPAAGAGPRPLHTRIGLINMSRALKGCRKFQALQADLRAEARQAQRKLEGLTREVGGLQVECDAPATPPARREECARRIRELKGQIEEARQGAQARMAKVSGDAFAALYREVEGAADRVAKSRGLELVLFYTDAVTEADYYNPGNLQRKMTQPGALMPLIVAAPEMDITNTVIEVLNRTAAGPKGRRP
jgi:RNA polymerase sigma factor (sigma-70 family)